MVVHHNRNFGIFETGGTRRVEAWGRARLADTTPGLSGVIDLTLVNSIHPGLIQTDMGEQTFVSRARNLGSNDVDAVRQQAMSRHPIGRLGVPEDIAKGIVFLASDDAGFMTGAGLVIDGGSTAQ